MMVSNRSPSGQSARLPEQYVTAQLVAGKRNTGFLRLVERFIPKLAV